MAGGKKDPINELSQKMLAGWILMAESCPLGCNVPLVENKKQAKIMCVSCDRHFTRDASSSELKPLPADTPLAVSTSTIAQGGGGGGVGGGGGGQHSSSSLIERINSNNNGGGSSSLASSFTPSSLINSTYDHKPPLSSVGELLLDAPPKRKESEYGREYAGDGEEDDGDDDDDQYAPPTDEEITRYEERRKRNDKVSVEIGAKLLAGWTMLDTHCPSSNCRTVLMKDKHSQKWCLACNTMIVTQEEYDAAKHVNVGGRSEPPTARTPPPILSLTPEYAERRPSVISEAKPPMLSRSAAPTPKMQALQSPHVRSLNSAGQAIQHSNVAPLPHPHVTSPPVFAPPLTYTTQVQIIDNTMQTLYQKLNEYTRLLSITTDLELSRGLCELIRECGLAISALSGVHKVQSK